MQESTPHRRTGRILPVSLISEGRPCVVVGAGAIARRKIGHLLDAGAAVTVVSPDVPDELVGLRDEHALSIKQRAFAPDDVKSAFVVFAATNDAAANAAVVDACRAQKVLCCAVDANWRDGDFVTPATVRKGPLSVAVSTSGQSCRRSRMIKESLGRHLDKVDQADLLVIGTSHNVLRLSEREPYHLVGDQLAAMGQMLMQVWGIHECMILNTCNRIELHIVAADDPDTHRVVERLMGFHSLDQSGYYVKKGMEAFRHSAMLLAGLLSQTPGENHIVAQVKEAVADAVDSGWAAGMMQGWLSSALHVAKHIRAETQPLLRDFEIEDLCLDYLAAETAVLEEDTLMILGTGIVGEGVLKRFLERSPEGQCIWCYHRQKPTLPDGSEPRVRICDFNALRDELAHASTIVCATASPGHILHLGHAPFLDQESQVTIVDLAMPRNVAPDLDGVSASIHVADLDDLKHWYRREGADMTEIMERSVRTATDHRDMYDKLTSSFQGRNTVESTGEASD